MKTNKNIRTLLSATLLLFAICSVALIVGFSTKNFSQNSRTYALTQEEASAIAGDYKTCDNAHTITINNDGSILFDGAYSLTASGSAGSYSFTGTLGTSNTTVNFVQLNANAITCVSHIKYTVDDINYVLYQNTPFVKTFTPTQDSTGAIEVWANGSKTATFSDFQSAFTYASNGNTIKLTSNILVSSGAVLVGKSLTLEGDYFTLDKSQYANTIFAVADDATLTINNLNIDGGAINWAVDFDAVTFTDMRISLVSGSTDGEPVSNHSAITSSGKLVTNNLNVSNIYTTNYLCTAIAISKGEVQIKNSAFNHNAGSGVGAIRIGFDILEDSISSYPVTNASFLNATFTNNYVYNGHGSAIYISNLQQASFEKCNFNTNAADNGDGAGIAYHAAGYNSSAGWGSTAHKLGLNYAQITINDCLFSNNWTGNDGFAIDNEDAECKITNCQFIGNYGLHPSGSVGTVSHIVERFNYPFAVQIIDNCLFEKNYGGVSCIGDHAGTSEIVITNSQFKENSGKKSILFYTGVASLDNCSFENEQATVAIIDVNIAYDSSYYEYSNYDSSTVTVNDTTFTNTVGAPDVLARKYYNTATPTEITVEGDTTANVELRQDADLVVSGTLTGDVTFDENTSAENNITVTDTGTIDGDISQYFSLTINYKDHSDQDASQTIRVDSGTTSSNAIECLLGISKTGYTLKIYTDSAYTTEWDYVCDATETLYGQWESAITINYFDQGGTRFSGTHATIYAQNHSNGIKTALDTPTKAGYVFNGWYLNDSTCTNESARVTELPANVTYTDVTLYAKWSPLIMSLTIHCENFASQQYFVYIYSGDTLLTQITPSSQTVTLSLDLSKNYSNNIKVCFVFGYYGNITYGTLTNATANGRTVTIKPTTTAQINYSITTPNINSSLTI